MNKVHSSYSSEQPSPTEKLSKNSKLRLLLDESRYDLSSPMLEAYLQASEFPLKPLKKNRKLVKEVHALPNKSFFIGEIMENTPNGMGYSLDIKGNYYEGYFENGVFSGLGRMLTSEGEIITGQWSEGDLTKGKILYFNGKTYEGELKNLAPDGKGQETSEEYTYEGAYFNGKKHGFGKVSWNDGKWYEGNFVMGRIEGKGLYNDLESKYDGWWKANKMHGNGVQTWNDGRKYEGSMINGLKEGYGVYFFDNKKFSGYWKNGKEDGKGILEENGIFVNGIWSNGQLTHVQKEILEDEKAEINLLIANINDESFKFSTLVIPEKLRKKCEMVLTIRVSLKEILWEDDKKVRMINKKWSKFDKGFYYGEINEASEPNGKGFYLNSRLLYEGYWKDGKKNGLGRQINNFDEIYIGNWINGVRVGFGTLFKKLATYIGDWKSDKFNGKGVLVTEKMIYDGDWTNGLQHGNGILEFSDGKVYSGCFSDGIICGNGQIIYPNGTGYKGMWENGEIVVVDQKITNENNIQPVEDEEQNHEYHEAKAVLNQIIRERNSLI